MSDDIVKRLRDNLNFHMEAQTRMHEAADEIECLRRDIELLQNEKKAARTCEGAAPSLAVSRRVK